MTPDHAARLRTTLHDLERELRDVDQVDPETRDMLLVAVDEIQAALHAKTAPAASQPHSLVDRLNRAAGEFDVSHPTLAGLVRRVVDTLAQLGI